MAAMRPRSVARWAEPAVAAGAVIVVGYGLAARLVPWLVDSPAGYRTGGRLDQPLTYWNALGALAALGLVLCARIAGDGDRPRGVRAAAAAAAAPLGAGIYLTYSRGAIVFAVIGLLALVAFLPRRATVTAAGLVGDHRRPRRAVRRAPSRRWPTPSTAPARPRARSRSRCSSLVGVGAGLAAREARRRPGLPRPADRAGGVRGHRGRAGGDRRARARRASPTSGPRTCGWRPARAPSACARWRASATTTGSWRARRSRTRPLNGLGSGGFGPEWLREGPADSLVVRDAHSLYVETAAELGLAGIACLAALLLGAVLAIRRALARDPLLAAGPAAALVAFGVHAGLDWDFEMPALTLPALLLLALLSNAAEEPQRGVSTR